MAYTKPTDINSLWAASGTKITPDVSKRSLGWIAEKPSWQYFNSILYRTDLFNAYVNERGIPEWDSITEYVADKSYIVGSNGFLYKSRLTQSGNDPLTDDGTNWRLVFDELGSINWNINYNYLQGATVYYSGKLWVAQESNVGITPSIAATEWQEVVTYLEMFKKMYAAAYTSGQDTSIGFIYTGVVVDSFQYMIYPEDGRLYKVGSVTGTLIGDFNPDTGVDSGLTGTLSGIDDLNPSDPSQLFDNIKQTATEIETGVARRATQAEVDSRSGDGFVTASKLEESLGVNQTWQNVTSIRSGNSDFTSPDREIEVFATLSSPNTLAGFSVEVGGELLCPLTQQSNGTLFTISLPIPANTVYRINISGSMVITGWSELR